METEKKIAEQLKDIRKTIEGVASMLKILVYKLTDDYEGEDFTGTEEKDKLTKDPKLEVEKEETKFSEQELENPFRRYCG